MKISQNLGKFFAIEFRVPNYGEHFWSPLGNEILQLDRPGKDKSFYLYDQKRVIVKFPNKAPELEPKIRYLHVGEI